jgi:hypothetical protein
MLEHDEYELLVWVEMFVSGFGVKIAHLWMGVGLCW